MPHTKFRRASGSPPRSLRSSAALVLTLVLALAACADAQGRDKATARKTATPTAGPITAAPLSAAERKAYIDAGALAWTYFDQNTQSKTGLTSATPNWANTTLWDIGAQILATYSAKELNIITADSYQARMSRLLNTVEKAPLYKATAYNRVYSTVTGRPSTSSGWSAMDLGRFLAALKLLSLRDPQFAAQAERIARKNDFSKIVYDGYLHGQFTRANGTAFSFQEGRLGYEQYAANGFSQWGANADNAIAFQQNGEPFDVLGVHLLADKRYTDRLLSEPFILYGLEFGLQGPLRDLAANVLKAQEARYKSTGQLTIMTEDAVSEPPDYFYYYCVLCDRHPFVVDLASPGKTRDHPRWISTKGAYGWDAIFPSDYTKRAVSAVAPAMGKSGWASGIYESNGQSTKTIDINTAAVMLEIALYKLRGSHPLVEAAPAQLR
jgi:hypothetical protein